MGVDAEYCTLQSEAAVRIPTDLDPAEAAPLLCAGVTLFNSVRNMKIIPGDIVAVQGLGGLGKSSLFLCHAFVAGSIPIAPQAITLSLTASNVLIASENSTH